MPLLVVIGLATGMLGAAVILAQMQGGQPESLVPEPFVSETLSTMPPVFSPASSVTPQVMPPSGDPGVRSLGQEADQKSESPAPALPAGLPSEDPSVGEVKDQADGQAGVQADVAGDDGGADGGADGLTDAGNKEGAAAGTGKASTVKPGKENGEKKKKGLTVEGDVALFCERQYSKEKVCPEKVCLLTCFSGIVYEGCDMGCYPRPCLEIDAQDCPLANCQVLSGCGGINRCFPRFDMTPPECGGLAYEGQDTACCEGFIKRCGMEFFDGSCDMIAEKSIYGVPICVPCGNGVCNQFENRCNCPEDCGELPAEEDEGSELGQEG